MAFEVQLSEHLLTQTSRELLLLMVSHSLVQESVLVFVQLVEADSVQLWLQLV